MAAISSPMARPTLAASRVSPISETLLAWFVVVTSAWFIGGVYLDGWAHNHGKVDDSFLTPWHAVLYSGYGATAGVLLAAVIRNRAAGRPWRRALPDGYGLALIGALIFAVGGAGDVLWHEVFGIEIGAEALLSPTHLMLALGGSLMASGPLRWAWGRLDVAPTGWATWLPVLLSLTVVLSFITFMTQFAHPFVWPQAGAANALSQTRAGGSVFAMNADGSDQRRVTRLAGQFASQAAWSPDGRSLALVTASAEPGTKGATLILATPSGEVSRPLPLPGHETPRVPVWSPDGQRLAFISRQSGQEHLYTLDIASGSPQKIADNIAASRPAWSPDGRQILFVGGPDASFGLQIVSTDGGQAVPVPNGHSTGTGSWSPDGTRIAFGSDRSGTWQVFAMNVDGTDVRQLTDAKDRNGRTAWSWWPTWSPDGSQIAFISNRSGTSDVFVMQSDGTGQTNLTSNPSLDHVYPAWSPDGRTITFTASGHVPDADLPIAFGVASLLVQATLLAGIVLAVSRRWRLPFGAFAWVFTLNAVLISFQNDMYALIPAATIGGLAADILLRWLRPFHPQRGRALRVCGLLVPVVLYLAYFAALSIEQGMGWSVHVWIGSLVMAGAAGWLLTHLIDARDQPVHSAATP